MFKAADNGVCFAARISLPVAPSHRCHLATLPLKRAGLWKISYGIC